jgi:hypothetical protein
MGKLKDFAKDVKTVHKQVGQPPKKSNWSKPEKGGKR